MLEERARHLRCSRNDPNPRPVIRARSDGPRREDAANAVTRFSSLPGKVRAESNSSLLPSNEAAVLELTVPDSESRATSWSLTSLIGEACTTTMSASSPRALRTAMAQMNLFYCMSLRACLARSIANPAKACFCWPWRVARHLKGQTFKLHVWGHTAAPVTPSGHLRSWCGLVGHGKTKGGRTQPLIHWQCRLAKNGGRLRVCAKSLFFG